ncbi:MULTISPECIES: small acid-soluble spore protein O [Bacillaceae]|uniref:Small acid-soluble spore protein O n=1 Tax=Peribacillus huizhouensis TaxID=1501239 RepID=A0ABR6CW67_9BACI|nr:MULTISPECIES: small acid-soluble spore protein O [Bacillaceae]MBA9029264.1 small acid-soluble spore protein O (minor) [Peribacillus huizhouensis]
MTKRKAENIIRLNAAKANGSVAGYTEEISQPLTEEQKQNNKKRKKNQ